jgi:hypothetical protein
VAGPLGIEVKNVRNWLYPDRREIIETIRKCLILNCVPVVIARRVPYVTFALLSKCGVLFHENYRQLFPATAQALADQARDKTLLGYHDLQLGSEPDDRLKRFLNSTLADQAETARAKFEEHKDLLEAFSIGGMRYNEFAGRVLRRSRGQNEDGEFPEGDPADW